MLTVLYTKLLHTLQTTAVVWGLLLQFTVINVSSRGHINNTLAQTEQPVVCLSLFCWQQAQSGHCNGELVLQERTRSSRCATSAGYDPSTSVQKAFKCTHFVILLVNSGPSRRFLSLAIVHKHTCHFNGHFPGKSGLARLPLNLPNPFVPNFSMLSAPAKVGFLSISCFGLWPVLVGAVPS